MASQAEIYGNELHRKIGQTLRVVVDEETMATSLPIVVVPMPLRLMT